MLHLTRIGVHPLTSFQPQRLQIVAEGEGGEPPAIHPVVAECQLLQHGAAGPDGADAFVAPLAAAQLQLHKTPAVMGQDGQPNIRNRRIVIQSLNKHNYPQDLEILEGGDRGEDIVGAAVELELLKGGALGGNGGKASFGSGDESELPEIGVAAGEGSESDVDIIRREEKLVEDEEAAESSEWMGRVRKM
ncbi:hypothetical protein MRB53_002502 [Persea americana]|uniref:Uncharacterized protein n=1 Tax=Persea americana TaxID=3435 RepID=A0ACC2MUV2_PERAE|nr:hypothetical protein MRB53_002502 [Persea americana]